MVQTILLKTIIENAEEVMNEFGGKRLTALHIVVAVADFCKTRYNGLDSSYFAYPRFEEERLRYILKKEIKLAGYFRLALSTFDEKSGATGKEFDFKACERIALARGADILSSDVVFVCALTQLEEKYKGTLRTVSTEDTVFALLEDTDKNIYDYTITRIEEVCAFLKKKSEEAVRIRDWKPAAKFQEPEGLLKQFFENVTTDYENEVLHILIPAFLRGTDLKLSIYKVKDRFIIHDNCSAAECLSKRIDNKKIQKIFELLWGESNLDGNKIFTEFLNIKSVLYFIQEVILTANADLYYEYFREEYYGRNRYIDSFNSLESEQQAEAFDADELIDDLKKSVHAFYEEKKGLTLGFNVKYSRCSYCINVLIETLENGTLRFSDAYKNKQYETGEMLEAFYFGSDNNEKEKYYEVIEELAKPFGMAIDMDSSIEFPEYYPCKNIHKNPYMLSTVDTWISDFYNFMNSAVLISVVADRINFEKVREW